MEPSDFQFVFLGNNLAVDFVNTELQSRGEAIDLLQNNSDLVAWVEAADLTLNDPLTGDGITAAKALRLSLRDLFQARMDKRPPKKISLKTVNQHLARYAEHKVLLLEKGEYALLPDKNAANISSVLAYLAYDAATLLASPQAAQLKRCSNPDCILLFVDVSRSQQRRWCSMDTCGNRAKVAKYYQRQSTPTGQPKS